jgi:hypothetical protein
MAISGYILAILMGSTLGLIGAGGSILTVPILVYFLHIPPITATSYSLFIVGATALVGSISYYKKNLVDVRCAITFAIPAMLSVLTTRLFVIPNLPEMVFGIPKGMFLMLLFASLMMLAAFLMLRKNATKTTHKKSKILNFIKLALGSSAIGFLTGVVGAGGGFLIIPTLITLFGLRIKKAIGTSLTIISINSLVGFKGDLLSGAQINWSLLISITLITIFGMLCGIWIGKSFNGKSLKRIFALLIIAIATAIFIRELMPFIF